jgi:hypothetical protein
MHSWVKEGAEFYSASYAMICRNRCHVEVSIKEDRDWRQSPETAVNNFLFTGYEVTMPSYAQRQTKRSNSALRTSEEETRMSFHASYFTHVNFGSGNVTSRRDKLVVPSSPKSTWLSRCRICKPFKEPRNRFPAGGPVGQLYLTYRPARLHRLAESIPGLLKR